MLTRRPISVEADDERAAKRSEAEARRQERAADSGLCSSCGKRIEPWRDSHRCALCARSGSDRSSRKCSRCGETGHRVETCTQPPEGWLSPGEVGTELVPVALTPIEQHSRGVALAEAERELRQTKAALKQARADLRQAIRNLEQRRTELADGVLDKVEQRPVPVRAELDGDRVRIVRCDTGEVLRERPATGAELAQLGGRKDSPCAV